MKTAGVFAAFALLASLIGDAATEIVAVTAALAGLGWFWQKILVPVAKVLKRMHSAAEVFEDLRGFMGEARDAVGEIEGLNQRIELVERHIGMWRDEDAIRARAAMDAAERMFRKQHDEK